MGRSQLWPSLAVVFSGAMWGLYWMPARWLDGHGIDGIWQSIILFGLSIVALLPFAVLRRRELIALGPAFLLAGLFTGSAFAFYTAALVLTEVVRALLLFYITPVWSTLIALALKGERPTGFRLLALALAFGGLLVMLDLTSGLPLPRNLGDWLALSGGFVFAIGSYRNYGSEAEGVFPKVLGFMLGGFVVGLLIVALPQGAIGHVPPYASVVSVSTQVVVLAILLFLPTTFLILWGTQRVDPARVGILLMTEIVVGVASAALLSGEPFGLREATGAALILGAGVVDVVGGKNG